MQMLMETGDTRVEGEEEEEAAAAEMGLGGCRGSAGHERHELRSLRRSSRDRDTCRPSARACRVQLPLHPRVPRPAPRISHPASRPRIPHPASRGPPRIPAGSNILDHD